MSRAGQRLAGLRKSVDALDRRLLETLNRRMKVVEVIGRVKRSERLPTYAPDREEVLLRALANRNRGPLTPEALRAIFREVVSAGRAAEEPLKIAYLGPEGTFSDQAARRRFGAQASYSPVRSIPDVFYEVDRRKAEYGMVPVENTTEGAVYYTLDTFMDSEVKICGEEYLPVTHVAMAKAKSLDKVKTVYSHPHVFGQCRRWLDVHLPNARQAPLPSTAEAAKAAARDATAAAIGPELAARIHGLPIRARGIEDIAGNMTRFFVLAKSWSPKTGRDKTSLMVSLKDRVGALYGMLTPFRKNGINLTSIESRPSRKRPWEYYFFIDCAGHLEDRRVARALAQLEPLATTVKILGSYPAASAAGR